MYFIHFANTLASTDALWFRPILVQRRLNSNADRILTALFLPCGCEQGGPSSSGLQFLLRLPDLFLCANCLLTSFLLETFRVSGSLLGNEMVTQYSHIHLDSNHMILYTFHSIAQSRPVEIPRPLQFRSSLTNTFNSIVEVGYIISPVRGGSPPNDARIVHGIPSRSLPSAPTLRRSHV